MDQSGSASPARANSGGICDRFLTFLANNLSTNRQQKNAIEEGPRSGVGVGGGYRQLHKEEEEEDEFAIRIERAEFELSDGRGGDEGHGRVTATVLEGGTSSTAVPATASDEQQQKPTAAADAGADRPVAAAAAEEAKVRKTVTIKEDRPEDAAGNKGAPAAALERKKSLFKKRQASTSGGAAGTEEQGQGGRGAPRRSGLRPRIPAVLRVPSNINEKSSTFIEERRKSFGAGRGKKAADSK